MATPPSENKRKGQGERECRHGQDDPEAKGRPGFKKENMDHQVTCVRGVKSEED
jgi:hypothetical protein